MLPSGSVVECLTRDREAVVSLSKNINPSLILVQPRKTRPFITERSLMGRKESNQTNKQKINCLAQGHNTMTLESLKLATL